jgi:hypothetical protein
VTRDRDRLKAALKLVGQPCPFEDGAVSYVVWNASRGRYVVKVVHPNRTCPALPPGPYQERATAYLTSLLELHGVRAAEYLDGELVGWHDWS